MQAALDHWAALSGGIVMGLISFFHLWKDKLPNRKFLIGSSIAFFMLALFFAWQDQFELRQAADSDRKTCEQKVEYQQHRIDKLSDDLVPLKRQVENQIASQTLWYLKLNYVQCEPPFDPPGRVYPFRIKVKVNSRLIGSFPHGLFAYAGLTNILEGGDAILLEPNAGQYSTEFFLQRLNTLRGQENDLLHSNLMTNAGNDQIHSKLLTCLSRQPTSYR